MIVQNTTVSLQWVLKQNPLFATYDQAYFDLQITDPEGDVMYFEGIDSWATSFTQPSDTVDGLITYDYVFTKLGVYTLILSTGGSTSFTILDTFLSIVVEQENTLINKVTLP